ncbi:MAG: hypothetical protein AAF662_13940 [Pseudomonadota bacterium]
MRRCFVVVLILFLICSVVVLTLDLQLRNEITPEGIVAFEFCGFTATCSDALRAWSEVQVRTLILLLGIDYLYLLLFPATLVLAIALVRRKLNEYSQPISPSLLVLGAGISAADAIENVGSLSMIFYGDASFPALLSALCATMKFLLLGVGFLWLVLLLLRLRALR